MKKLILILSLIGFISAGTANAGGGKFRIKDKSHKKEVKAGPFKYKKRR